MNFTRQEEGDDQFQQPLSNAVARKFADNSHKIRGNSAEIRRKFDESLRENRAKFAEIRRKFEEFRGKIAEKNVCCH